MNVFGNWRFSTVGSDVSLGSQSLVDSPLSSLLVGKQGENLNIEQFKMLHCEEIICTFSTVENAPVSRAYQVNRLNLERYKKDVIYAILIVLDSNCKSFLVVRIGPGSHARSSERFSVNADGSLLKIDTDIVLNNGLTSKHTKFFNRLSAPSKSYALCGCGPSLGWLNDNYHSSDGIKRTAIQILNTVDTFSPCGLETKDAKNNDSNDPNNQIMLLTRHIDGAVTDGERFAVFVINVTVGEHTWQVAHRYKEFDALRIFINSRRPQFVGTGVSKQEAEPVFPSKTAGMLASSSSAMAARTAKLGAYLRYQLEQGGYEVQDIIDVLSSFLEIPEHMSAQGSASVTAEIVTTAPTTAAADLTDGKTRPPAGRGASVSRDSGPAKQVPAVTANAVGSASSTTSVAPTSVPAPPALNSATARQVAEIKFPQDVLHAALNQGIVVIKHGRQGAAKRKLLRCNHSMTRLFWQAESIFGSAQELPAQDKSILISDIVEIRRGTDVDKEWLASVSAEGTSADNSLSSSSATTADSSAAHSLTKSSSFKMFGAGKVKKTKTGTSNLRRGGLSAAELGMSLSLILSTRSLDIQFLCDGDFSLVYLHMLAHCRNINPKLFPH